MFALVRDCPLKFVRADSVNPVKLSGSNLTKHQFRVHVFLNVLHIQNPPMAKDNVFCNKILQCSSGGSPPIAAAGVIPITEPSGFADKDLESVKYHGLLRALPCCTAMQSAICDMEKKPVVCPYHLLVQRICYCVNRVLHHGSRDAMDFNRGRMVKVVACKLDIWYSRLVHKYQLK